MAFITRSFQVENELVDSMMAKMSGNELKCYLLILRKTRGWNKFKDAISISQFVKFTGLSNRVVIKCCKFLIKIGFISRSRGKQMISIFNLIYDEKSYGTNSNISSRKKSYSSSYETTHTKDILFKNTIKNKCTNKTNIFIFNKKNKEYLNKRKKLLKAIQNFRANRMPKPTIVNIGLNKI